MEIKARFFAIVELHSRPPANSDGGKIGGSKLRTSILSTVVATLLTVCASPAAFATEYSPKAEENPYSILELSQGESVSVPHGYDIGFVEEKPSFALMARSANTAPSCIQARVEKLAVQVYNNCESDMRVKVIMTADTSPILGAKDSACNTIAPGTRSNVRWIIRGNEKIDRVELC